MRPSTRTPETQITRVYLTGFMGAGKSSVGRLLADNLDWQFFDVDSVIEHEQQQTVADLFSHAGEEAFRALEHQVVQRLQRQRSAIISLGGGALETAAIRSLVHASMDSLVVFLEAPLSLLIQRCLSQYGGAARPLLQDREHLGSRYDSRLLFYRNAHLTVATESLTPEEVAASILKHLAAWQNGNNPRERSHT